MKDCYTEGIYCEDKEFALSDSNQIAIAEVLNKNSAVGVVGGYYDGGHSRLFWKTYVDFIIK